MRATTAAAVVEEVAVPLSHCTSRSGNATRVDILAGDHGNLSAAMLTEKNNNKIKGRPLHKESTGEVVLGKRTEFRHATSKSEESKKKVYFPGSHEKSVINKKTG